jgi:hypothetical protein
LPCCLCALSDERSYRREVKVIIIITIIIIIIIIIIHVLDHVKTKNVSAPFEKFTDWERFQSLASNLISPRNEINSGAEADKAARVFAASLASSYRLSTSKITSSELKNDLPGLDRLLKYKKRMRKSHVTATQPVSTEGENAAIKQRGSEPDNSYSACVT